MHVLSGNVECYKFIDEPRHVKRAFALVDCDEVVVLGIFFSKLHHKTVIRLYRLVHIVKAYVARNNDRALGMEVEFKIVLRAPHAYGHTYVATLDFVLVQRLEPSVAQAEVKRAHTLVQLLQIYLKYL